MLSAKLAVLCGSIGSAGLGLVVSKEAIKNYMKRPLRVGDYPDIDLGLQKISVQLSTLNEEDWIEPTVKSIIAQPLYEKYHPSQLEIVLIDSSSTDRTVEVAEDYVDYVIEEAPRGLFTARNIGAEQSDADIIVSVDAAQTYPKGWLNLLLRHFSDPSVVAVTGAKLSVGTGFFHSLGNVYANLLLRHIWGDNSAILRDIWMVSGGWNENLDQLSFKETWSEEFSFYERLAEYGKVIRDITAVTYELRSRFACNRARSEEEKEYCMEIERIERF